MQAVAIFGVPRSGTSWLGQLFNSSPHVAYRFQPLFSYAFKGRLESGSTSEEIIQFYAELANTEDAFVRQYKNISGNKAPLFEKEDHLTHLVWKEVRYHHVIENLIRKSATKVVGIVRHPCGVINSWLQAPKEFDPAWNPVEEWRYARKKNRGKPEEYNGYEKWKEVAFLYLRLAEAYPEQFCVVTYEALNVHTTSEVKKLFGFADLAWAVQTEAFIKTSKETGAADPYGVFRAKQENHDWKKELPVDLAETILADQGYQELDKCYQWNI